MTPKETSIVLFGGWALCSAIVLASIVMHGIKNKGALKGWDLAIGIAVYLGPASIILYLFMQGLKLLERDKPAI